MRNNDTKKDARELLQKAFAENDKEAVSEALQKLMEELVEEAEKRSQEKVQELRAELDSRALQQRGVRQLTGAERNYYQKLIEAMKSPNPEQALSGLDTVMPETVINSVFEDLRTEHPLLSELDFMSTGAAIKLLMNTDGTKTAAWGKLSDKIVTELSSGFKEVDAGLYKLSAFIPVNKPMLDLGPEWLDRYVRTVLYEALACGLEEGSISGDGNNKPIGMIRQVGDGVTTTGGAYPEKEKIKVSAMDAATMGNLLSLLSRGENGRPRKVNGLIMVVNPTDYFQKIMPATTVMAPDGTYRNNVLPYPVKIIQSEEMQKGTAVLGMGKKYFAAAGTSKNGRIEYSDHYRFLEDERVYLIKLYANGMPKDNNAFLHLDISGLEPKYYQVEPVTGREPSSDATLSALKLGSLTLSPAFAAATTSYTASTTDATNTVKATPTDAAAEISITHTASGTETEVVNGEAVTWASGSNTLTVKVVAEDGKTTKTYTVTVTKS